MKQKRVWFYILLEILAIICMIYTIFVPVKVKSKKYINMDTSDSGKPVLMGALTQQRPMQFEFYLEEEELASVSLCFYADGDISEGTITASIYDEEGTLCSTSDFPVQDLITLSKTNAYTEKEIIFENMSQRSGKMRMVIESATIETTDLVSVYGNRSTERYLIYDSGSPDQVYNVMYAINVYEKNTPHVWAGIMIFVMCSFTIGICILGGGGNKRGRNKKEK